MMLLCSNYMQVKAAQEQQEQYRQYMAEQRRRQQNPFYGAPDGCMGHHLCHFAACCCLESSLKLPPCHAHALSVLGALVISGAPPTSSPHTCP